MFIFILRNTFKSRAKTKSQRTIPNKLHIIIYNNCEENIFFSAFQ